MYDVTQDYLDKAIAAGRVYSLRVDVGRLSNGSYTDVASYTGGVGVLALKIVRGQTTGGFSLGGTVCASLNGTFANSVNIKVKDRLQVYVRFGSGTNVTAWRGLGWFYVDSVKRGVYSQSVVAYDAMLRLEKNYKSKLTYPAKTSDVLAEISSQANINLSAGLTLINDAVIEDAPLKDKSQDGEQRYYTRREMLGYIGATNAGSGYIDVDFKINLSTPTEVSQGIAANSVISQSIDDTDFSIANIVWNKSGVSYSLNDEFTENTVELVNPLGYTSEELILHNLETKLVGLTYSSVKLKKQGTGIYQLGDLVDYTALDGTVYKMLVMGIVYDFSNGFFSETLYSLAKSASQQEYAGSQTLGTVTTTMGSEKLNSPDGNSYAVMRDTGELMIFKGGAPVMYLLNSEGMVGFQEAGSRYLHFDEHGGISLNNGKGGTCHANIGTSESQAIRIETDGVDGAFSRGIFALDYGSALYVSPSRILLGDNAGGLSIGATSGGFKISRGSYTLEAKPDGLYFNGQRVALEDTT